MMQTLICHLPVILTKLFLNQAHAGHRPALIWFLTRNWFYPWLSEFFVTVKKRVIQL